MKYVFTIVVPAFVIFLQIFIKNICGADFTPNLGITIGAIGLGQIFPFIAFENLLFGKVLNLKKSLSTTGNSFTIQYSFEQIANDSRMENIKALALGLLFLSIAIFMIIVYMSVNDAPTYQRVSLGLMNCIISWSFILSK